MAQFVESNSIIIEELVQSPFQTGRIVCTSFQGGQEIEFFMNIKTVNIINKQLAFLTNTSGTRKLFLSNFISIQNLTFVVVTAFDCFDANSQLDKAFIDELIQNIGTYDSYAFRLNI